MKDSGKQWRWCGCGLLKEFYFFVGPFRSLLLVLPCLPLLAVVELCESCVVVCGLLLCPLPSYFKFL